MLSRQNKTWSGMSHTTYPVAKPMLRWGEMTDLWVCSPGWGASEGERALHHVCIPSTDSKGDYFAPVFKVSKIIALQLWFKKCWRKQCQQQERKERRGLVFHARPTGQVPTQAYAPSLFPLVAGPLSVSAYAWSEGGSVWKTDASKEMFNWLKRKRLR